MIYVFFALVGLGSGAIISLLAISLIVGYQGSGVINFSLGAVAMYVGYTYFDITSQGVYPLPIPGLPAGIHLGVTSVGVAMALALATAALLGGIASVIFNLLRSAPTLAKVVASVGLMVLLQAVIAYRFGTDAESVINPLPPLGSIAVAGAQVPGDQLALVAIAVAITSGLWLVYHRSKFGVATRAAAENEKGAVLVGYSPERLAATNWIVASILAGLGGVLVAPITTLTPTGFELLIIPALAAVLCGGVRSLGATLLAGLIIGIGQTELTNLPSEIRWFPSSGTEDAFPFLLILVALLIVGKRLPTRGELGTARLPRAPRPTKASVLAAFCAIAATIVMLLTLSAGFRIAIIDTLIGAILCLSLVVLTGYAGQISLFQLAMAGVAAYLLAGVTGGLGVPLPLAIIIASLGAAGVGLIAAVPAVRVRGVNLAITTLAGGWALEEFVFNNPSYTGGFSGPTVPSANIFGINIAFARHTSVGQAGFGIFALAALCILGIGVANMRRSGIGRSMLAVRSNERVAASGGINVTRIKLLAFAISAFIAGVGGCLIAYEQGAVTVTPFDVLLSISLLISAYLGGITTVSGAIIGGTLTSGAFTFYLYERYLFGTSASGLQTEDLLLGVGTIMMAILNPSGIAMLARSGIATMLGNGRLIVSGLRGSRQVEGISDE
jgi:ABC-type branched-subunit amino acid transport system permease subunit